MSVAEWISLVGLIGGYVVGILVVWIKTQVKLKELDIRISGLDGEINEFKTEYSREHSRLIDDNKEEHKEIMSKMDSILEILTNFRIEMEKRIK